MSVGLPSYQYYKVPLVPGSCVCLQVLDSFGEKMTNWQDLRYTVQHNIYDVRILL